MKNIFKIFILLIATVQIGIAADDGALEVANIYRGLSEGHRKKLAFIWENTFVLLRANCVLPNGYEQEKDQINIKLRIRESLSNNPRYKIKEQAIDDAIKYATDTDYGKFYELYTDKGVVLGDLSWSLFYKGRSDCGDIVRKAKNPANFNWDAKKYPANQTMKLMTAKYFVRLSCEYLLNLNNDDIFELMTAGCFSSVGEGDKDVCESFVRIPDDKEQLTENDDYLSTAQEERGSTKVLKGEKSRNISGNQTRKQKHKDSSTEVSHVVSEKLKANATVKEGNPNSEKGDDPRNLTTEVTLSGANNEIVAPSNSTEASEDKPKNLSHGDSTVEDLQATLGESKEVTKEFYLSQSRIEFVNNEAAKLKLPDISGSSRSEVSGGNDQVGQQSEAGTTPSESKVDSSPVTYEEYISTDRWPEEFSGKEAQQLSKLTKEPMNFPRMSENSGNNEPQTPDSNSEVKAKGSTEVTKPNVGENIEPNLDVVGDNRGLYPYTFYGYYRYFVDSVFSLFLWW